MSACIVKVVQNSGQPRYYTMEFKDKTLVICIHIQNAPTDLDYMVSLIQGEIVLKRQYSVTFNYKAVSETIRTYYPFKEKMIKLLQKKDPDMSFDALLEIVRMHIQKGKHPNFNAYEDPKRFKKISNYISSVVGCKVSSMVVTELCKKIITFVE